MEKYVDYLKFETGFKQFLGICILFLGSKSGHCPLALPMSGLYDIKGPN